jgi:aminotransferase
LKVSYNQSKRLKTLKPSGIRHFFSLARKIPDVINLSIGEPDFNPPKHVLEAGCKAAYQGETHYAPTNGLFELRDALSKKAHLDYGLQYDPEDEILIIVGGTEGIFSTLLSLTNPGDEVLIPDPGFVLYKPCVLLADCVPISIPLLEKNHFEPSCDTVTSLITDKSRVMILNSPSNPTGAVFPYKKISELAKIAKEYNLIVISDEVYEKIRYNNSKHHCVATFPDMRDRTLVVNSFSKTYAMTGLRVGYIYGPRELISSIWLVHQYIVACVNSLSQRAALAALDGPQNFVTEMISDFRRRRQMVYERIKEIDAFRCALPNGAFYMFPNLTNATISSEQFAQFLLNKAHVAVVPGSAFGANGEGYIRISYAAAYEKLEEALNRIDKALKKFE